MGRPEGRLHDDSHALEGSVGEGFDSGRRLQQRRLRSRTARLFRISGTSRRGAGCPRRLAALPFSFRCFLAGTLLRVSGAFRTVVRFSANEVRRRPTKQRRSTTRAGSSRRLPRSTRHWQTGIRVPASVMDATDHAQPEPKPCLSQPPREGRQHHSAAGRQKCRGKERLRLSIGESAAPTLSRVRDSPQQIRVRATGGPRRTLRRSGCAGRRRRLPRDSGRRSGRTGSTWRTPRGSTAGCST